MPTKPYFSRVWVTPYSTGGVAIQWRLNPTCGLSGTTFSFNVYRGVTGQSWDKLTTTPVVDDTIYIDESLPVQHDAALIDGWYMVSVIYGSDELESDPVPLTGQLSALEWRLVREQTRAHTRLTETYCGIPGWLFRKRDKGTRCDCYDEDLDGVTDSTCAVCKGTGWLGGYYPSIAFTMIPVGRASGRKVHTPTEGVLRDDTAQYLCQAIPLAHAGDVWMHGVTGDHYTIDDIKISKAYRGVPLAMQITATPATPGSIKDTLMPTDYTAPEWTGTQDTSEISIIRFAVTEDLDLYYTGYDPDEDGTAVDMNDVTPVFDLFDDEDAMNAGDAAIFTIGSTQTANGSYWAVDTTDKLHMYMSLDDVEAVGVGEHYYRVTFTYDGSDEVVEIGQFIIEAE